MSLAAGTKLGPYEILAPIGAGGMGEVYRAKDTKLDREVAIKVLPAALAQDPERLARFEREAKVLASLNHPNIAQIYGVEERALVMELVPGDPLTGPLPLETALNYAKQIADALETAHEKNIIHRDLKPANIMITSEGVVKVLDFGLAAIPQTSAGDPSNPANSPTLTISPTRAGMILGTAAYMSPEQAAGKPVDKRADIWSFGVVLFEMLTGKRLFDGETISHILAAVLTKEADLTLVPEKVRRLLEACLQKNPKQRLQAIGDWRLLLTDEQAQVTAPSSRSRFGWLAWAVAAVLVVALVFTLVELRDGRTTAIEPVNLSIALPQGQFVSVLQSAALAISVDGKRVVYRASGPNGQLLLYLRDLDSFRTTPIPGTQGAESPFFSPDGQWIAFTAQGKLKKVALAGGAAQVICDSFGAYSGGTWDSDGNIYFARYSTEGIFRVSAAGGTPQVITRVKVETEDGDNWPQVLPGGKALLMTTWDTNKMDDTDDALIEALNLSTGQRRVLIAGGSGPRFVPPHFLVYARAGNLMLARFDPDRLEVQGTPVQVLGDLMTVPLSGAPQFAISATGTLVYLSGPAGVYENNLDWIERGGKAQPFGIKPGLYQSPRFSPDGRKVALTVRLPTPEIWIYDLDRGALQQMTFAPGENEIPVWSPDGRQIAYAGNGRKQAYVFPIDGNSPERAIAMVPDHFHLHSWSADGSLIALERYAQNGSGGGDIWMLPTAGNRQPYLYLNHSVEPAFSPDGHWLAYVTGVSEDYASWNVYIQRFPGPGERIQVSTGGGDEPVWSRDGRELYYEAGDTLFGVSVATAPKLAVGKPEVVFKGHFWRSDIAGPNYDVAPDGKRFLMLDSDKEPELTQIHVILNWAAQLK